MHHPSLQEGELRQRLADGGRIKACLVVVDRNPMRGAVEFIPFFKVSWSRDTHGLALYRGKGLRAWSDFRKLVDFVGAGDKGLGFAEPLLVAEWSADVVRQWGVTVPA